VNAADIPSYVALTATLAAAGSVAWDWLLACGADNEVLVDLEARLNRPEEIE
jgi:hypothetical protein